MAASLPTLLAPPESKGHLSVARLERSWYIACAAREVAKGPVARTIMGLPLVLFRGADGAIGVLLDRCAHRNVPLSVGTVRGNCLECLYHGWQYDGAGVCRVIPGLVGDQEGRGRQVPSFPVREQDGFVWVCPHADGPPDGEPFKFPLLADPRYTTVYRAVEAQGSVHAVAENALDVPHTAFLHRGLFRGTGEPNEIEVVVRRGPDRVEAEYIGEPRPSGLAGRILSPSGGLVTHFDRFLLPSMIQVEYSIGTENHILVCAAATPVKDFQTVLHAVVSFRLRVPHWLVKPFLLPIALRIFKQDATMLKLQTASIERFGGEQYVSTEIDVLGRDIWRLLRQAERGERPENGEMVERRLTLRA